MTLWFLVVAQRMWLAVVIKVVCITFKETRWRGKPEKKILWNFVVLNLNKENN